ncbi:MAG: site-2 protease family protein [Clostridia bacterium]|nr:site-2 protease family protein [Clostridia bacterium]
MLLDFLRGDSSLLETLYDMLVSLPGILVALSLHEAGHAYAAWRCGDPTARDLGRLSINPLRHIDPTGFLMMMLVHVGYAKPVPVNPNNFRRGRRDDLLVSLAGITSNLLQFLAALILIFIFLCAALKAVPQDMWQGSARFLTDTADGRYRLAISDVFGVFYAMHTYLIGPYMGTVAGFVYEVLIHYCIINFSLACFNLMPVPPLDGYHVLNDLVLKKSFFASAKAQRIGQGIVLALVFSGLYSRVATKLLYGVLDGAASVMQAVYGALPL